MGKLGNKNKPFFNVFLFFKHVIIDYNIIKSIINTKKKAQTLVTVIVSRIRKVRRWKCWLMKTLMTTIRKLRLISTARMRVGSRRPWCRAKKRGSGPRLSCPKLANSYTRCFLKCSQTKILNRIQQSSQRKLLFRLRKSLR